MPVKPSWHFLGRQSATEAGGTSDSWDLLDDFLRRLQEQESSSRQMRLMLDTLQQMTRADLVYACSSAAEGPVEQTGPVQLPEDQCREMTRRLLAATPDGDGHLIQRTPVAVSTLASAPHSAALVRLSKSHRVWIVAVIFSADRVLRRSDVQLMRLARRMLHQQNRQAQIFTQLKETLFSLVRCLTASLDVRDPYTWGHSERVARMSVRIAQEMKIGEPDLSDLYLGGLLHDIGKIGVRDDVLRKPSPLSDEERLLVEKHPVIGDAILSHVEQLAHLRPVVRNHHERHDGRGYPDHLAGENIPLSARILAVADSCDAMLSERPYRKGMPPAQVDEILRAGAGSQWDPDIIPTFFRCRDDVYAIHERGVGDSVLRAVGQVLLSLLQGL